jgi:predicted NBD/HSP70 family sugar kinase
LAGIDLPIETTDAERLRHAQDLLQQGHEGARDTWRTIGTYLGYTVPHYADFYDIKHVLLLGRCTSGVGGDLILETAQDILTREFPEIAESLTIQLPDDKSRRVGQSIAAASLPQIAK